MSSVCVAIPTFRRPALLRELLDALGAQSGIAETILEVLVVDNDPGGSAEATVAAFRTGFTRPLHYVRVGQPGLSTVRNFALSWARDRFSYLAMIDDDEKPEPQWLSELLRVAQRSGAEVVVGPVPAILPRDAPRWLHEFRELEVPTFADCALLSDGWTGNCLLALGPLNEFGVAFDPALNAAGGEDQLFFRQLLARGAKIAYAARATAWEFTPPERQTIGYMIRRSFRRGNTVSICDRRIRGTLRAWVRRFANGLGRIALGAMGIVPQTIGRGAAGAASCGCEIALGVGMVAGVFGYTYRPYRRQQLSAIRAVAGRPHP